MRWLLAVGIALSAVIMPEEVAGYEDVTPVDTSDWYMEKYLEKMRIAAKDTLDVEYNTYWTIEQRECEKQDVNGYLFHMHFLASRFDSNGKLMTKDCNMSMHFFHDGKTEPKITEGPQCKDV